MSTAHKTRELLEDLAFENPPLVEKWMRRGDVDLVHGLGSDSRHLNIGRAGA